MKRGVVLLVATLLLCSSIGAALAAAIHQVVQKNRRFAVEEIEIAVGDTIRFTNDDAFLHQIYVTSPDFTFDSAEQPPGEVIEVRFPAAGAYVVLCHIHPKMHLTVNVR